MNILEFTLINKIIDTLSPNWSEIIITGIISLIIGLIIAKVAGYYAGKYAADFTKDYENQKDEEKENKELIDELHVNLLELLNFLSHITTLKNVIKFEKESGLKESTSISFFFKTLIKGNNLNVVYILKLDTFLNKINFKLARHDSIIIMNMVYNNLIDLYISQYNDKPLNLDEYEGFEKNTQELMDIACANVICIMKFLEYNDINCSQYKQLEVWNIMNQICEEFDNKNQS